MFRRDGLLDLARSRANVLSDHLVALPSMLIVNLSSGEELKGWNDDSKPPLLEAKDEATGVAGSDDEECIEFDRVRTELEHDGPPEVELNSSSFGGEVE